MAPTCVAGRELRVVMNTNDPDYEHIYSIENYDDPLEEVVLFTPNTNQSKGMPPLAPHHTPPHIPSFVRHA